MIASKWMDPIIGVDIHIVLVPVPPAPPIPTPLPHPFTGIVFDPVGLIVGAAISAAFSVALGTPFQGPVLVNSLPAANTGTGGTNKMVMPHFPMPPGVSFVGVPANDTSIVTGSKTVYFSGSNAARLGSMTMSCAEPVRLPSSTVLAIPMGGIVLVGGPPAMDFVAALMGMIRTQWVSGKLHGLVNRIRSPRLRNFLNRVVCFFTGHPVDVMTGKVVAESVDFKLPGPIPFKFERVYYSSSKYNGPLGHGWHHSYDQHIRIEDYGIVLRAEDGREIDFDFIGEDQTTYNPIECLYLTRTKDGFILRNKERLRLFFKPQGRADGTIPLSSIADMNGNEVSLKYDSSGRLIEIIDSVGRHIRFVNDHISRLIALNILHPDGKGNIDVARFEYDQNDDLVSAFDALDHAYHYKYKYHLLVQETNKNGLSFYFEYDGIDEDAWCVRTWGDDGVYDHVIIYDKNKHITIVEDSMGAKKAYYGDEFCCVIKIVDPLGGATTYEYDNCCRRTLATDPNGNTMCYEYDNNGNRTGVIEPNGSATKMRYNNLNQEIEILDAEGNRWRKDYDPRGNLIMEDNPTGAKWEYRYDDRGNITEIRTPLGYSIKANYNTLGHLMEVTHGNYKANMTYDSWGNLIQSSNDPSDIMEYQYDLLGRLTAERNSSNIIASYTYDAEGNTLTYTNANRLTTSYKYGGFNKLLRRTESDESVICYEYDTEGRLTSILNENGESYSFEYNSAGMVTKETDFNGYTRQFIYDSVGDIAKSADGKGRNVEFGYDQGSRITKRKLPDGSEVIYQYNIFGELICAGTGENKISFDRDSAGRIVKETIGDFATEYQYDASNNVILRRSPLGNEIKFSYNQQGLLTLLELPGNQLIHIERDSLGRETKRHLPNGRIVNFEYNSDSKITSIISKNTNGDMFGQSYRYDPNGNILEAKDLRSGSIRYEYDTRERLKSVFHSNTESESFAFDPAGNITHAGKYGDLKYESHTKVSRSDGRDYDYDYFGNLVAVTDSNNKLAQLKYDSEDRLISFIDAEGKKTEYAYDPIERRTMKKSDVSGETRFCYSGFNLLFEKSSEESIEYVFSPNTFEPICMIANDGLYFFHNDYKGLPTEITDSDGKVVWAGLYDAYGVCKTLIQEKVSNNLRFPGQYYDKETNLHYSIFRYFDPEIGRFITTDPIGIIGGMNIYEYTPNPIKYTDPLGLGLRELVIAATLATAASGNPQVVRDILEDYFKQKETIEQAGRRIPEGETGQTPPRPPRRRPLRPPRPRPTPPPPPEPLRSQTITRPVRRGSYRGQETRSCS